MEDCGVHRTLRVFWIKHIILAREISLGGGRLQVKEQGSLPRKFQTHMYFGRKFIACNFWFTMPVFVMSCSKSFLYTLSSV